MCQVRKMSHGVMEIIMYSLSHLQQLVQQYGQASHHMTILALMQPCAQLCSIPFVCRHHQPKLHEAGWARTASGFALVWSWAMYGDSVQCRSSGTSSDKHHSAHLIYQYIFKCIAYH